MRSINGVPIRLTDERWEHIATRHPEMASQKEKVFETLGAPDLIQAGDFGTLMAAKRYGDKYLVVVYREVSADDGFVITSYFAEELSKRRRTLWKS